MLVIERARYSVEVPTMPGWGVLRIGSDPGVGNSVHNDLTAKEWAVSILSSCHGGGGSERVELLERGGGATTRIVGRFEL